MLNIERFSTKKMISNIYSSNLVMKLTGATPNQLKYWCRIELVHPELRGRRAFYSFKDIIKLRVLVSLRKNGLSLQKVRFGIEKLSEILPDDEPLSRLLIYTDGSDMIVLEKGRFFSAITKQQYFCFDTGDIEADLAGLQKTRIVISTGKDTDGTKKIQNEMNAA